MSEDSASAPANVSPGEQIAGYRLEEQIGQGGMAVVYRAHDDRLDRRVALKLLAPGLASDTAFRTRFIRESRAAAAVDHPNIIPVYDAGDAGGFLFISMRYVQGGDVRSLIADGQPLPPARAWNIISQVAAALDAAHAHGLVHRDVKPANMLLDASGRNRFGNRGSIATSRTTTSTCPTSGSARRRSPATSPRPGSLSAPWTTSLPSRSRVRESTAAPTSTRWPAPPSSC